MSETFRPPGAAAHLGAQALSDAFGASPTPMVLADATKPDLPIVWVNDAFVRHTGYAREELTGRSCRMLQGPDSDPAAVTRIREAVADALPVEIELFNYRKDGTAFWNAMTISPVHDAQGRLVYFYSAQADMTDKHHLEMAMRGTNDELERLVGLRTADLTAALEQKTALLHEVDHRVKNNLQVISSLMLLKARRTPEGEARKALLGMAERVGALSTAHRLLYSAGDVAGFNLRDFAADFTSDLHAGLDPERTRLHAEVDSIAVPAAMAAPLALLIHELTTNAIHHAFPGGRSGRVAITAQREGPLLRILIEDDGVGMPGDRPAGEDQAAGFGRSLVEMVVRQLRGQIAWHDAGPGTRVEVGIPLEDGR